MSAQCRDSSLLLVGRDRIWTRGLLSPPAKFCKGAPGCWDPSSRRSSRRFKSLFARADKDMRCRTRLLHGVEFAMTAHNEGFSGHNDNKVLFFIIGRMERHHTDPSPRRWIPGRRWSWIDQITPDCSIQTAISGCWCPVQSTTPSKRPTFR